MKKFPITNVYYSTEAVLVALLQLSFQKTLLNLCFSVAAYNEQAVDNFNFRTEDLSTTSLQI